MIEKYERKTVFSYLKKYDYFAGDQDYIEITEWKNGEGYDIEIMGKYLNKFQLTNVEYFAVKKLIDKLEK